MATYNPPIISNHMVSSSQLIVLSRQRTVDPYASTRLDDQLTAGPIRLEVTRGLWVDILLRHCGVEPDVT